MLLTEYYYHNKPHLLKGFELWKTKKQSWYYPGLFLNLDMDVYK
jgi:hypothetical protein